jgi:signal transduction histidine kinase
VLVFYAAITTGVLFGALIGIHAARVNRSKAQLATQNEQLETSKAQLAEQNERLEEFTSMVSHDLRNPLQATSGFLDLAEETGNEEYFDRCQTQVDRMHQLIEDMLALARADERSIDIGPVSLAAMAEHVWKTVDTDGATLITTESLVFEADGRQTEQLLKNLVRNALEHGGSEVTVTIGALSQESGFYVADDGPGIPVDEREQVFEHGYSTGTHGTGYGLTIVTKVADVHGWDLTVTESADGGARFEIHNTTYPTEKMTDERGEQTRPVERADGESKANNTIDTTGEDRRTALQGP